MRGAARTEQRLAAVSLAESLLAGRGREQALEVGETSGSRAGMKWTVSVSPADQNQNDSLEEARARLYVVTAKVAWGAAGDPGAVSLTSLRIQTAPRGRR